MTSKKPNLEPTAMTDAMKEQAQQIWLAGLGAFAKAQQEGSKAFEKLVTDGISMQRKAQSAAEEKLAEATQQATQAAHAFNERATGQWGKLEGIFEERVARALQGLGLPSAAEMKALQDRVSRLEAQLGAPAKAAIKPRADKKASAQPIARKTPNKRIKTN